MRKISLHNAFLIQLVLLAAVSVLTIGCLWIFSEKAKFEKESEVLWEDYLSPRKASLKREVSRALMFVKYMKSQTEKRLRSSIRERVYEAHTVAEHIYRQNIHHKSIPEIQEMIKDALRPVRFKQGRGYLFIFDMNAVEVLFPVKPDMEGKSMLEVTGGRGEPVVPEMLSIVKQSKEGFYRYTWPKPGKEGYSPKIAFVKLFEPVGWVIGAGEYLDDVEKDIQKECIGWISNIRFGKDGYVFAGQWDGLSLSGPAAGKNMIEVEDVNGVKIVQELIKAARSGGGFVKYVLPKFEGKKQAPKLSYADSIPEWQWYVGSGMYIDEIERVIEGKRVQLNKRIKKSMLQIFFILLSIVILIIVFVRFLAERIKKNLDQFTHFFKLASEENVEIERETIHFQEFDQMAVLANQMVQKQRESEEALQVSHQRFLRVLDGIEATICVVDLKTFEILFMNKYMKEIFGGEFTGKLCWDVFRNEDGPCPNCSSEKLFDSEGNIGDVRSWQGKNPVTKRWYSYYDRAIEWTDGRIVKIQIATDITDFKKMEEALRHAHKMESIGTLAGGIAHDFNNILSIIIGNVELALESLPRQSGEYGYIQEIKTASLRARDVVRQLLSFSRKSDQGWVSLDLVPVVKEAVKLIRSLIPSHIDIQTNFPETISKILGDATQVHQAVINLCTNASHAIDSSQGVIAVALEERDLDETEDSRLKEIKPGRYIEITIRDNGTGIDPEVIDRIFDPYFTTKDVGQGTGMGLAVVHGIVKNHNGAIYVDSQKGVGSIFHLFFPVTEDPIEQKIEPPDEQPSAGGERILFVDDEKAVADIAQKVLQKIGYQVEVFTSPEQAVERFENGKDEFDLVITDMAMPKMSGLELARNIKKLSPDIPVILCTGHADLADKKMSGEPGIDAVEVKPVPMNQMARTIRSVLNSRGGEGTDS